MKRLQKKLLNISSLLIVLKTITNEFDRQLGVWDKAKIEAKQQLSTANILQEAYKIHQQKRNCI